MALTDTDIEELVYSIIEGAEAKFAAAVTERLLDNLKAGILDAKAYRALEEFSAMNARDLETLLMQHHGTIKKEVLTEVTTALMAADGVTYSNLAKHKPTTFAARQSAHYQAISSQTAQGLAEIIDRQNIAMVQQMEQAWYEVSGKYITAINHGSMDIKTALAQATAELMGRGLETIDYKSGIKNQLDVALKRHLVTQASQAGGRMMMERLEQWRHSLVAVSAHFGARPEHEVWQGKAYSLHGQQIIGGVMYRDFYRATEYGKVTGLKGANCRHFFYPYYPGLTTLQSVPEKHNGLTSKEYYDATQRQRHLERAVRKTKREIYGLDHNGLGLESPTYVQKRLVLGSQQKRLAAYVKDKGLVRQYSRGKTYGVSKQPRALRVDPSDTLKRLSSVHAKVNLPTLKTLDQTLLNTQFRTLDHLFEKYSKVANSIGSTFTINSSRIQAIAQARVDFHKEAYSITLSKRAFSSKQIYLKEVWEGIQSKYFMPARKNKATQYAISHEFGHIVHYTMLADYLKSSGLTYSHSARNVFMKSCRADIMDIVGELGGIVGKSDYLSTYATVNDREFFAECFANLHSGSPNVFGKAMDLFLERRGLT